MQSTLTRWAIGTLAAIGIGASTLVVPATATAAPVSPHVPGTSCSLHQVERDIAAKDPRLWHRLETHPKAKQRFERLATRPEAQRHAEIAEFLAKHPRAKARYDKNRGAIAAKVVTITRTCSAF